MLPDVACSIPIVSGATLAMPVSPTPVVLPRNVLESTASEDGCCAAAVSDSCSACVGMAVATGWTLLLSSGAKSATLALLDSRIDADGLVSGGAAMQDWLPGAL